MPYDIKMLGHYPSLKSENVKIVYNDTYSMLARRVGVVAKPGDNPEKVADEPFPNVLRPITVALDLFEEAQKAAATAKFSPEWIANLGKISFNGANVMIQANNVNYGSLPAIRVLNKKYYQTKPEELDRVMSQISPIGVIGTLVSEKNQSIYIGRRSGNVLVGEKWMSMPAGTIHSGDGLLATMQKEAKEENSIALDSKDLVLVGAALSVYHAGDTNFNYIIKTDLTLEQIRGGMNNEHDAVEAVQLDERAVKKYINDQLPKERMIDAGIAALLQVGRSRFGTLWYGDVVEEIKPLARIEERNLFA